MDNTDVERFRLFLNQSPKNEAFVKTPTTQGVLFQLDDRLSFYFYNDNNEPLNSDLLFKNIIKLESFDEWLYVFTNDNHKYGFSFENSQLANLWKENLTNQINVGKKIIGNTALPKVKNNPKFKKLAVIVVCVIIALSLFSGKSSSSNSNVKSCAKTLVSQQLKSSTTARWGDITVLDKDKYGRYLVDVNVEATNSFGAYVKGEFYVVIWDVEKSGSFRYNKLTSCQSVTTSSESYQNLVKTLNDWDEPIDD